VNSGEEVVDRQEGEGLIAVNCGSARSVRPGWMSAAAREQMQRCELVKAVVTVAQMVPDRWAGNLGDLLTEAKSVRILYALRSMIVIDDAAIAGARPPFLRSPVRARSTSSAFYRRRQCELSSDNQVIN
jgi:hypothetical protein